MNVDRDELTEAVDVHAVVHLTWVTYRNHDKVKTSLCSTVVNAIKVTPTTPRPLSCFYCMDIETRVR